MGAVNIYKVRDGQSSSSRAQARAPHASLSCITSIAVRS